MTHSRSYFGRNIIVFLFLGSRGGGGAPVDPPLEGLIITSLFNMYMSYLKYHTLCTEAHFIFNQIKTHITVYHNGGPDAVIKAACLVSQESRVCPPLWHSGFKETIVSSPLTNENSDSFGASVTEVEITCSASGRQGSNPVSGGQCHLIHLTILRRFSWESLAYMCTKVAIHLFYHYVLYPPWVSVHTPYMTPVLVINYWGF